MRQSVPFTKENSVVRREPKVGIGGQEKPQQELPAESNSRSRDDSSTDGSTCATQAQLLPPAAAELACFKNEPTTAPKKISINETAGVHIDWKPVNNGHSLRINISGKLDFTSGAEWQRLMRETADSTVVQFEFNLIKTAELSLTGLGMLLLFREQKKSRRQDIRLNHCNRQVRELLLWTGMDQYFLIQAQPMGEQ